MFAPNVATSLNVEPSVDSCTTKLCSLFELSLHDKSIRSAENTVAAVNVGADGAWANGVVTVCVGEYGEVVRPLNAYTR